MKRTDEFRTDEGHIKLTSWFYQKQMPLSLGGNLQLLNKRVTSHHLGSALRRTTRSLFRPSLTQFPYSWAPAYFGQFSLTRCTGLLHLRPNYVLGSASTSSKTVENLACSERVSCKLLATKLWRADLAIVTRFRLHFFGPCDLKPESRGTRLSAEF